MLNYIIPFLVSFSVSLLLTPVVRRIAISKGYISKPRDDRWHRKDTPIFGGIAIFTSFIVPYFIFIKPGIESIGFAFGALAIFIVGLMDDIISLKPYSKLMGQIIVGSILCVFGIGIKIPSYPFFEIPLTVLWVVGIVNAFNLLDNMDGLSAGIGAVCSIMLSIIFYIKGNTPLMMASLMLTGSCLGFLRYNFHPAQIFMGDCGSMFIGFCLSTLTLLGTWYEPTHLLVILAVPVLVLAVPIMDTLFVTLMRGLASRRIFEGGKDHISHRMVALGFSESRTVIILYVVTLVFGCISVLYMFVNPILLTVIMVLSLVGLVYFMAFLGKVKVYSTDDVKSLKRRGNIVVLDGIVMYKRRMLEVMVDFILICVAYISAYLLRYEGVLSSENQELIVKSLPIIIVIKYIAFFKFGVYRGIWKYVGIPDLINIFKAVSIGSLGSVGVILFIWRFQGFSRAVFVIDWILLFVFVSGSRVLERVYKEIFDQARLNGAQGQNGKKVLIYGAGDAGEILLRELKNNKALQYKPVGFIDDDREKIGRYIHGVPVFGPRSKIAKIIKEQDVDEIIVAISRIPKDAFDEVSDFCKTVNISCRRISEILSDKT